MSERAKLRSVVFALFEGVQLLDVAGPAEVLSIASDFHPAEGYDLRYIAPCGSVIRSSARLVLTGDSARRTPSSIHTLIIPGSPMGAIETAMKDARLIDWLRSTAARAGRVASICTGAFLLGETGLLAGRRATTHWSVADRLAKMSPTTRVDANALYIEDGHIWTSAGVSAGIDLALALVARDLGPQTALKVARELVVQLVRSGGQSQFSGPLELQARARPRFAGLIPWIEERMHTSITVEMMADAMGMTRRSFQRRCASEFGLSPARLVNELRLEQGRMQLLDPAVTIAAIAGRTGFADGATFSKAFKNRFGASPTSYRHRFRPP